MAINDFNLVAPYYDKIARLVFGNHLIEAQIQFLDDVREDDRLLIVGGGAGELLKYLPKCRKVDYVEKSARMIERALKVDTEVEVEFINEDFFSFSSEDHYDLIICPFFLDCFSEERLKQVINKIQWLLKPAGSLLVADFQKAHSNSLILTLMHVFFGVFANLESKSLQNIHQTVTSVGFRVEKEKFSHRNQLFSRLYRNL